MEGAHANSRCSPCRPLVNRPLGQHAGSRSEDTVHMLEGVGVATGIDLDGLIEAARAFEPRVGCICRGR